jgi:diadenosine tetraphosphate (Ap4A) HIT family hydrolase
VIPARFEGLLAPLFSRLGTEMSKKNNKIIIKIKMAVSFFVENTIKLPVDCFAGIPSHLHFHLHPNWECPDSKNSHYIIYYNSSTVIV